MKIQIFPKQENAVRDYGRSLRAYSVMGMLAVALYYAIAMSQAWKPVDTEDVMLQWQFGLRPLANGELPAESAALLAGAALAMALAWFVLLVLVRRLGFALSTSEPLDARTAGALKLLAHGLLAGIALRWGAGQLLGEVVANSKIAGPALQRLDGTLSADFLSLIASTCLYALARVVRNGAEAAEDARSIV